MTELSSDSDMTELSFSMSANMLRTDRSKMVMKRQHDSDSQGNPCGHGWSHTQKPHGHEKKTESSFSKEEREENKTDSERVRPVDEGSLI